MIEVTIRQAKTQLCRLIKAVLDGEEVVISNRNKPVARLVALSKPPVVRELGWGGPGLWMAEDFDAPLDELAD